MIVIKTVKEFFQSDDAKGVKYLKTRKYDFMGEDRVSPLCCPSLPPCYPGVRHGAPPSPHGTPTSSFIMRYETE